MASKARILFYLPAVTPWWFDNIVTRLVKLMAPAHEVHILVAPLWGGTGIGPSQAEALIGHCDVNWHIIDQQNLELFRTAGREAPDIAALIERIDPDYVICRSADIESPKHFPGKVRYIMEAGLQPLPVPDDWVAIEENIFEYGCLPTLDDRLRERLRIKFLPVWTGLRRSYSDEDAGLARQRYCDLAGLPSDKKIIALPLEYEHEENLFRRHTSHRRNCDLISTLLDRLGDEYFLAITNHPLNDLYVDNSALEELVAANAHRAKLVTLSGAQEGATRLLARHSDGLVVGNSKSIAIGAFLGKPMLRLSTFRTGTWMNVYRDLDAFLAAIASGKAASAAEEEAMLWFAFHAANNVFNLQHDDVDAPEIIDRLDKPFDPDRWDLNLARYKSTHGELFAC